MRLIMKCGDKFCNIGVDAVEKVDDVVFAYKRKQGSLTADEFAGIFSLGSVDFLYVTDEKTGTGVQG